MGLVDMKRLAILIPLLINTNAFAATNGSSPAVVTQSELQQLQYYQDKYADQQRELQAAAIQKQSQQQSDTYSNCPTCPTTNDQVSDSKESDLVDTKSLPNGDGVLVSPSIK